VYCDKQVVSLARPHGILTGCREKPYYVSPDAKGGRPYALLRDVLKRTDGVGLGKIVLSNKQHLGIIAPHDNALVLLVMRWEAEVRDTAGLPIPGSASRRASPAGIVSVFACP
jgi:DNA end-binding protein Ku